MAETFGALLAALATVRKTMANAAHVSPLDALERASLKYTPWARGHEGIISIPGRGFLGAETLQVGAARVNLGRVRPTEQVRRAGLRCTHGLGLPEGPGLGGSVSKRANPFEDVANSGDLEHSVSPL